MSIKTIVRYGSPGKFDEAEYGSRCIVRNHHDDNYELYLQVNKDPEVPKWELAGVFSEKSSQYYIDQIVDMRLYQHKS